MAKGAYRTMLILEALRLGDKAIDELYQAVYQDQAGIEQLSNLKRKHPKHGRYRSLRVLISLINRDKVVNIKSGTRITAIKIAGVGHYGVRVKYHLVESDIEGNV